MNTSYENVATITEEPVADSKVRRHGRILRLIKWAVVGLAASGAGFVVWQVAAHAVRESQKSQCDERLLRLGVALQRYVAAQGHFPAPAITGADGKPRLSWRVAILPQLGYQSLYERFHLNEPWDSPHNRALLAEMPTELACPGATSHRSGQTVYLVIVGPKADLGTVNTPFEPGRGADIREFTDGLSNTVLVFETDTAVPWTKPDDLEWVPEGPSPRISSAHEGGTHALFADGSRRFLRTTIESRTFRAILTSNGGEVVSSS
jgi:hypothetical protein